MVNQEMVFKLSIWTGQRGVELLQTGSWGGTQPPNFQVEVNLSCFGERANSSQMLWL